MVRQTYGKPTPISVGKASSLKPINYKEPNEKIAPLGFASSILNGTTMEGGLKSLTYKSVFASRLVSDLRMVRKSIVGGRSQLSRLSDKDWVTEKTLERLRDDIDKIKQSKDTRNHENDEKISSFNLRLDNELISSKDVSEEYSTELKRYYAVLNPNSDITYHNEPFRVTRHVSFPSISVQKMTDVEGFDTSIYERKAEERRQEEELQKRREQEEFELAQNAKEAALEANAREESLEDFSEPYVDDLTPDLANHLDDLTPDVPLNLTSVSNPNFPTDMDNLY